MASRDPRALTVDLGHEHLAVLADALQARGLQYERARDTRAVFTLTYSLMTRQLASSFGTPPDLDWQWIARIGLNFGNLYLEALDAADGGGTPPPAWAHTFGVQRTQRTSVLEDLLFPLTVHIVRDLPHALCAAGLHVQGQPRLREYHHVNDVLGDALEAVQSTIATRYGPFTAYLDMFAGGSDEILSNFGFRVSRSVAWYNANRLLDPDSREAALRSIERSPRIFIEAVMNPRRRTLHFLFRVMRLVSSLVRRWPTDPIAGGVLPVNRA